MLANTTDIRININKIYLTTIILYLLQKRFET